MKIATIPGKYSGCIKIERGKRAGDIIPVADVRDGKDERAFVMLAIKKPMNGSKYFHGGYHRKKKAK